MNAEVAEKIANLMYKINCQLNDSVAFVMHNCTNEEFEAYRKSVGMLMGNILIDIENPIYKEHPSLLPEGLGGSYKVNIENFEPRFYKWNEK